MHIAMNSIHSTQLDLNLLKTFDALFVTRSASRAAAALGVGQPAVSHALGRLRNAIGDPLFVRTAGRMEPTARAQRLAEPVREALMAAGRALSIEESFDPAHDRRIFSVSASDSLQKSCSLACSPTWRPTACGRRCACAAWIGMPR
jgi:DNA-binding transcriptional LysR family regulator